MKAHRIFAITAFVLSLIGGVLVAVAALSSMGRLSLTSLVLNGLELLLALGAILGGWLIYVGLKRMGGFMTLLAGTILLVLTGGFAMSVVLIIFGGVLGLVAAEMKPWWAFWK